MNTFEAFLGTIQRQPACRNLFGSQGEEEYQAFCNVLNQTVYEFANIPAGSNSDAPVDWTDASFDFPDICSGPRVAPTVCAVCRSIRDAFVAAGTCQRDRDCRPGVCQFGKCVDWNTLTRTVVDDVFDPQPDCAAIRTNRGGNPGYGSLICKYVLSTNDDFTCAAWTGLVAGCNARGITNPADCFRSSLTSTLIQTAAYVLHDSTYCESILGSRQLEDILV